MTNLTSAGILPAKIPVGSLPGLYGEQVMDVTLTPGLTALVGPNGLGKSQVLRLVRDNLRNSLSGLIGKYVRYLSSGRGSPFEQYRAAITNPNHIESGPAAVGHASFRDQWWAIESVVGDFLALERRADLRLKVQARVQQLLGRSIELAWTQAGLQPTISSRAGGAPYNANVEASGVLQLVPLLAATYNDEISALLIEEPEISLHPQHQSFLLDELRSVAGDPYADPRKKLVVFATHSPTMLPIRTISEIPTIVFFNHQDRLPVQVRSETGELQRRKLAALTARMGATHRLAFFAESVLLVEGPSDETVVTQLARRLELSLGAANTQILPVIGKGEFIEAAKLFGLIGKRVTLLADLDALVDSNEIVLFFGARLECAAAAAAAGHPDVAGLDGKLRTDFNQLIVAEWACLAPTAEAQRYWTTCPERERTETT